MTAMGSLPLSTKVQCAAPRLSASLQYAARVWWSYHIGFELLIYNALFTMLGMLLLVRKK